MQNHCVAYGDLFQSFPKEIPQFCILHFSFCIWGVSTINCNLGVFPIIAEKYQFEQRKLKNSLHIWKK